MKGGRDGKGAAAADLLICFPSRSHFALMPKPICSPVRPSEQGNRPSRLRKSTTRGRGGGRASPLFWVKTKPHGVDISEPTSPKVTCAGQIKAVRPKSKNWQTAMDEIERLRNDRKERKRGAWIEALGFKKDLMQLLTCLRSFRFHFRCLGSFPATDITSDEEDDDEEEDEYENNDKFEDDKYIKSEANMNPNTEKDNPKTVFSKWYMILQEEDDQNKEFISDKDDQIRRKTIKTLFDEETVDDKPPPSEPPCAPPSNALLLMRCRSAPAKSWQEEKEEEEKQKPSETKMEESDDYKAESLVVMAYDSDFSQISSDIVKETWIVDGIRHVLARSRSWRN